MFEEVMAQDLLENWNLLHVLSINWESVVSLLIT